jgi:hypothetical protein
MRGLARSLDGLWDSAAGRRTDKESDFCACELTGDYISLFRHPAHVLD